jgi:hypothetical protein
MKTVTSFWKYSHLTNHNTAQTIHLTLSDPTSDLVQHYDFPVPLRCRKTSDTFLLRLWPARSAVGACPTLFLT